MTPGLARVRTRRILGERIAAHGFWHPATFAAYGRANVAWDGRTPPPRPEGDEYPEDLPRAYTTAQLRAFGHAGWNNRRWRRYKEETRPMLSAFL